MEIVTSFNAADYDKYVRRMLDSFLKFWPSDTTIAAYYHDGDVDTAWVTDPRIEYRSLHGIPEHEEFYSKFSTIDGNTPNGYNYRYDARKFTHKVFAIADALEKDEVIWLDADTETTSPVSIDELAAMCQGQITYLGRVDINYAETSFMCFRGPEVRNFWRDLTAIFVSGEFQNYKEWHDGYVFERLRRVHEANGMVNHNLTPGVRGLNAFEQSPLGKWMRHYKGDKKEPKPSPQGARIIVEPKDSVPNPVIFENIDKNVPRIDYWLKHCNRHDGEMIVLSAGPSIKTQQDEIVALYKRIHNSGKRVRVVCVKHIHNWARTLGIPIWGCILLDPRPFDELSTTGHKRSDLIAEPIVGTKYFVAAMTEQKVLTHLLEKKAKVVGWHAYTKSLKGMPQPKESFYVTGGTCSAMRAISIGHILGFRKFHLFGFDGNTVEKVDMNEKLDTGQQKYFEISVDTKVEEDKGRRFITTGEWMALVQDFERLTQDILAGRVDIDIKVYGESLISAVNRNINWPIKEDFHTFERDLFL